MYIQIYRPVCDFLQPATVSLECHKFEVSTLVNLGLFLRIVNKARGVVRIFHWGGPKYRFQNFGKCNLGKYPLPPGMSHPKGGGSGYFPK